MEYSLWIMGDVVGSSGRSVVVIYLKRRQDMRERTAGAKGLRGYAYGRIRVLRNVSWSSDAGGSVIRYHIAIG